MSPTHRVLLLGGTGRTGGCVLTQLLERGVAVRALVRSASRLPDGVADDRQLEVIEGGILDLTPEQWRRHLQGCDTVVSCLGHTNTVSGIFGPPFDLVVRTVSNVVRAASELASAHPIRLILMSSVSVSHPRKAERMRGSAERAVLWVLRGLVPLARDNQRAADFLSREVGTESPSLGWVVIRPDSLREGVVSDYRADDELVTTLRHPNQTNIANVAHFMCELATDDTTWARWAGEMPAIFNVETSATPSSA